jgi:hypothetical protein
MLISGYKTSYVVKKKYLNETSVHLFAHHLTKIGTTITEINI